MTNSPDHLRKAECGQCCLQRSEIESFFQVARQQCNTASGARVFGIPHYGHGSLFAGAKPVDGGTTLESSPGSSQTHEIHN